MLEFTTALFIVLFFLRGIGIVGHKGPMPVAIVDTIEEKKEETV